MPITLPIKRQFKLSLKLSAVLLATSMFSGCASMADFTNSADSFVMSEAALEEMNAVNAAMNAVEILYQRGIKQELAYYSPVHFKIAVKKREKLLKMYESYTPNNGGWFSNSGSEDIETESELFVQSMNKAFQAKLITAPLLSTIRDHDEFIHHVDMNGFEARLRKLRDLTIQFASLIENRGSGLGLEHQKTKLERDYKALEIDIIKRKVLRLPTSEFNSLDQEIIPESYNRALNSLYSLERLIETDPRNNTAIQQQLTVSHNKIKQADSIAKEVTWVKSRIETSAERVVINYRDHLSSLNSYLGTENLTSLDFQSQVNGIKDAVASKLSQRDKEKVRNDEHLRNQLTELGRLLTGQDMSKYSISQQVDNLIFAARTLVDESIDTPLAQR
ncbi:hypothetical protein [Moritella viscosa]|uniref:Uncharacterized protein n=1 Tax=Moritella viscosa TaxID=80854 RepID=A0A090IGC7_9GAMM|nr:hypothetical protein [Moritella viscosa]CED61291.1 putative lipoprotein [Moritella viscosa]SGY88368.1 Putative uncharacterized protein [Moritella viscosa]SGY91641.1 Putative uncharacterized protein [Moritella viscosa]SGY91746.1 Putative uncharacterized protein [Moritella viscosa]SGY95289.1 Putative uncharacterized protein [Moritella viscosa]